MFVASESSVTRHGAFALEREPQQIIKPIGTGVGCLVGEFPWGPASQDIDVPYEATDRGDMLKTFGPIGMDRTQAGYLSMITMAFPTLKAIRILGSAAAAASADMIETGPTTIFTLVAKYKGTEGNSIDATVSDADDGDSDHFNLEVFVTDSSGTTKETWRNLNYSGVGTAAYADCTNSKLVASATLAAAGRPDNGTTDFTGGLDGTIDTASYTGTAGAGDSGIALAENDKTIRAIYAADTGNTIRAAVNAALVTHANAMGDRKAFICGNSGQTLSAVQTDSGSYSAERCIYMDPWIQIYDDVDGTLRNVAPSVVGASLRCQLAPSTSIAWKSKKVQAMLSRVVSLETPRGNGAGSNTNLGIATIIKEESGGFTVEAGVTCAAPAAPTKKNETRLAIGDYIACSFVRSVREMVDAPNVELNQQNLVTALQNFMETLVGNSKRDPNNQPHVVAYAIPDLESYNTTTTIANGNFYLPLNVQTSSGMERIFLSIKFGEGVDVTVE